MRAIVVSDSHGDTYNLEKAIKLHRNADMVIFLGDGERNLYSPQVSAAIENKVLAAFKGDCDFYSSLPEEDVVSLGGKRIYCLHGHTKGVKHGFEMLEHQAKLKGVDIAVHGHTHEPRVNFSDGIWYMCPGSIKTGWYGIIDIDESTQSVICYLQNLFFEVK